MTGKIGRKKFWYFFSDEFDFKAIKDMMIHFYLYYIGTLATFPIEGLKDPVTKTNENWFTLLNKEQKAQETLNYIALKT